MDGRLKSWLGVGGMSTKCAGALVLPGSTSSRLPAGSTTRRVGLGFTSAKRSSLSRMGVRQSSASTPPCRTPQPHPGFRV